MNVGVRARFLRGLARCVRGDGAAGRDGATLRADAPIGADVDALRWRGPRSDFAAWSERLGTPPLRDEAPLRLDAPKRLLREQEAAAPKA